MLIIFGFKTAVRMLGVVTVTCRRCGNPVAHRLEERRRVVTLFFVPILPLGRRTVITCTYCGVTSEVEADHVPVLVAQAHDLTLPQDPGDARREDLPGSGRPSDRP
jgi:hypothetical protein